MSKKFAPKVSSSSKSPAKAAPAAKAPAKAKALDVGERATLLLQTMIATAGPIKKVPAAGALGARGVDP